VFSEHKTVGPTPNSIARHSRVSAKPQEAIESQLSAAAAAQRLVLHPRHSQVAPGHRFADRLKTDKLVEPAANLGWMRALLQHRLHHRSSSARQLQQGT